MPIRVDTHWDCINDNAYHHWRIEELILKYGLQEWCEFPAGKKLYLQYNSWLHEKWGITVVENDTSIDRDPSEDYCYFDFPSMEHAWRFFDFYKDKDMYYWEDLYNVYPEKKGRYVDEISMNAYNMQVAILKTLAPEGTVPVIPKWRARHSGFDLMSKNPPITEVIYEV